jgi:hypothetical protein
VDFPLPATTPGWSSVRGDIEAASAAVFLVSMSIARSSALDVVASSILVIEGSPTMSTSASCFLVASASVAVVSCAARTASLAWTAVAPCCRAALAAAAHWVVRSVQPGEERVPDMSALWGAKGAPRPSCARCKKR